MQAEAPPKKNTLKHLMSHDKAAVDALAQVKSALAGHLNTHPETLCDNPAQHLAESLQSAGLDKAQQKSLLNNVSLKALAGELLLRFHKKMEKEHEAKKKKPGQEDEKNKKAELESKRPEAEFDADDFETDNDDFKFDKHDFEPDTDEQPEFELKDVKEVAQEIENLNDGQLHEFQNDLLEDIKDLPSVGDQAAWMFVVSQLDASNMGFRIAGAAHLTHSIKNAALSVEDKVLAFAGAEALRDPNTSPFQASTPGSIDPGSMDTSGALMKSFDMNDERIESIAQDHGHKNEAPFTLLPPDETVADMSQFANPVLSLFRQNNDVTKPAYAVAYEESGAQRQQTTKAKSIFGSLELKPNDAFFRDVLGGGSSQN